MKTYRQPKLLIMCLQADVITASGPNTDSQWDFFME